MDICNGASGISLMLCNLGANTGQTIRNIVLFLVIIAVVVALVYLLYGGIKWITSKGEKTEVEAARNHIMAAVMGLIVVFLAIFILSIILAAFNIKWSDLTIPTIGSTAPIAGQ
jgi:cytochrome bd-type quinol oxidase subunit 2